MAWFSFIHTEKNEIREFRFFGKKMRALAVLTFISDVMLLLIGLYIYALLIFPILLLGIAASLNIENADENLDITELRQFQVRYRVYIFSYVLTALMSIFSLAWIYYRLPFMTFVDFRFLFFLDFTMDFSTSLGFYFVVNSINGIFELRVWRVMIDFFTKYSYMFEPCDISQASKGCKLLKKAGLCYIFSFLVIPIPIGVVLRMIGHYKLSSLTKELIPLEKEGE